MLLAMMPDIYFVPYFIIGLGSIHVGMTIGPVLPRTRPNPTWLRQISVQFSDTGVGLGKKKPDWGWVDVTPPPLPVSKYVYILTPVLKNIYLLPNIFIVILKKYILSLHCYHYTKISLYI